jgi:cysteine synthase A
MLPDTGERYLSTPLFDGIEVDMNDAEQALFAFDAGLSLSIRPHPRRATSAPARATAPSAPAVQSRYAAPACDRAPTAEP